MPHSTKSMCGESEVNTNVSIGQQATKLKFLSSMMQTSTPVKSCVGACLERRNSTGTSQEFSTKTLMKRHLEEHIIL